MDQDQPFSPRESANPSARQHIASFRKLSDRILASAALAAQDNRPEVAKAELARTLKRAAPALGIRRSAYQILDILLGLVRPEDFASGKRPIVAISNDRLMQYTGASIKTVSRCLKSLVEAGILAYRDSPTGRRYVYRKHDGTPDEAYGLDFTPACFNLDAFAVLADEYRDALNRERNARRAVTRLSRAVIDLVEAAGPDFSDYATHAEKLLAELRHDPEACAERLQALYDDVLGVVENRRQEKAQDASKEAEMSPAGGQNVPHIYNTNPPPSVFSRNKRTCSNEQEANLKADNGFAVEMALEKEPCGAGSETQHPNEQAETVEAGHAGASVGDRLTQSDGGNLEGVSIGLIQSACSLAQTETNARFKFWADLCAAAEDLRLLVGLSEAGYTQAVLRHGKHLPAACLAVVAEKALRDPRMIASPGGYFRAMIDRASDHKLNLKRSLFGLAHS
ncbi:plasmid replication protein RepC [Labrenzia sp. DG1229]|uniref:plasmid replication protein RepC n=1 Tax=Labrenzia sp. DG1229 TaxID=681847 RepID=UPI0007C7213A|nr:plasmid replication protein RepC [Labrenzia sp. DG1229]